MLVNEKPKLVDYEIFESGKKIVLNHKKDPWRWIILPKKLKKILNDLDGKKSVLNILKEHSDGLKFDHDIVKMITDLFSCKFLDNISNKWGKDSIKALPSNRYLYLRNIWNIKFNNFNKNTKVKLRRLPAVILSFAVLFFLGCFFYAMPEKIYFLKFGDSITWKILLSFLVSFSLLNILKQFVFSLFFYISTNLRPNLVFHFSPLLMSVEFSTSILSLDRKLLLFYAFLDLSFYILVLLLSQLFLPEVFKAVISLSCVFLFFWDIHPLRPSGFTHFTKIFFERSYIDSFFHYVKKKVLLSFLDRGQERDILTPVLYLSYSIVFLFAYFKINWLLFLKFSQVYLFQNTLTASAFIMVLFIGLNLTYIAFDIIMLLMMPTYQLVRSYLIYITSFLKISAHEIKEENFRKIVKSHFQFKDLKMGTIDKILKIGKVKKAKTGSLLYGQNFWANSFIIVLQGQVTIRRTDKNGICNEVAREDAPVVIGTQSLLRKRKRHSEIITKGPCAYIEIDNKKFLELKKNEKYKTDISHFLKNLDLARSLARMPFFKNLPEEALSLFLSNVKVCEYEEDKDLKKIRSSVVFILDGLVRLGPKKEVKSGNWCVFFGHLSEKIWVKKHSRLVYIPEKTFWNILSENLNLVLMNT